MSLTSILRPWFSAVPGARVLALAALALSTAGQQVKLNAPLEHAAAGQVLGQRVSADGSFLVYAADPAKTGFARLTRVSLRDPGRAVDLGVSLRLEADFSAVGPFFELAGEGKRVVFLAWDEAQGGNRLYSLPSDGSAPPVDLSGVLPQAASANWFVVSPDGAFVVFHRAQDSAGISELHAVPVDGSAPPRKLSGPASDGPVWNPRFGADGDSVYYQTRSEDWSTSDLFRGTLSGRQPPRRLNGAHPRGRKVNEFLPTPDGAYVLYLADSLQNERFELFRAPADASAPAVVLNPTLATGGDVRQFALAPDGKSVVYLASVERANSFALYVGPLDGSSPPRRLSPPGPFTQSVPDFQLAAAGTRVVYRLRPAGTSSWILQCVALDGVAPAVRLDLDEHPELTLGFYWLTPDGARVVYFRAEPGGGSPRMFSALSDGSALPVPLAQGVRSYTFGGFSSDSQRVVLGTTSWRLDGTEGPRELTGPELEEGELYWSADVADDFVFYRVLTQLRIDLFRAPVDGSAPSVQVNAPFGADLAVEEVTAFELAPAANRAAYVTDLGALYGLELGAQPRPVKLADPYGGPYRPLVSPDGRRVAFQQGNELWATASDGSEAPLHLGSGTPWRFTADSQRLLYLTMQGAERALQSVRLDGSAPPDLLGIGLSDTRILRMTPDTSRVVFGVQVAGDFTNAMHSARSDGSAPAVDLGVRVGLVQNLEDELRVSPDGRFFVCEAFEGPVRRIVSVPIDGSAPPVTLQELGEGRSGSIEIDPSSRHAYYLFESALYRAPLAGGSPELVASDLDPDTSLAGLSGDGMYAILVGNVVITHYSPHAMFEFDVLSAPLAGGAHPRRLNEARVGPGSMYMDRHGTLHLSQPLFLGPGGHVVFAEGERLLSARVDGSRRPVELATGARVDSFASSSYLDVQFTPDGASAVFVLSRATESLLVHADLEGGSRRILAQGAASPAGLRGDLVRVSADGTRVVYLGDLDDPAADELFLSFLDRRRQMRPSPAGGVSR